MRVFQPNFIQLILKECKLIFNNYLLWFGEFLVSSFVTYQLITKRASLVVRYLCSLFSYTMQKWNQNVCLIFPTSSSKEGFASRIYHKPTHWSLKHLNLVFWCDEELRMWIFQNSIQNPSQDHQVERLAHCGHQLLHGSSHLAVAVVKESIKPGNESSSLKFATGLDNRGQKLQPKTLLIKSTKMNT